MLETAYIFGTNSTIAQALARLLAADYRVIGIGRDTPPSHPYQAVYPTDYSEASLAQLTEALCRDYPAPTLIISCIGILHNQHFLPEKKLADLNREQLLQYSDAKNPYCCLTLNVNN